MDFLNAFIIFLVVLFVQILSVFLVSNLRALKTHQSAH